MRLFLGLPLPASYQDGLARLIEACRRGGTGHVSWTRPGNWHLTLKFLGDVAEERVDSIRAAVRDALAALPFCAFSLKAAGAGAFPSLERPRVVWAGVGDGAEECRGLAGCIERALVPLGFAAEERPFAPHLTVARIKDGGRAAAKPLLAETAAAGWPTALMGEVVLWQSVLGGGGPAYTRLASFPASKTEG